MPRTWELVEKLMSDSPGVPDMNILFVHENGGISGGAETNIRITAEELGKRGHTVGLLHTQTGKPIAWGKHFSRTFILPVESRIERAREALRTFKPDILYIHKLKDLRLFEALLQSHVPAVRMIHDHELYCLRNYKYNPLTRKICTRSASGFCVFPCLAPLARNRNGRLPIKWASYGDRLEEMRLTKECRQLIVYSDYSKGELVRNGFDPTKIHIHVPILCWDQDGPTSSFSERNLILFAGQIIRGKGVDLLLKSLSKLNVPFECTILGDGSHRASCEKLSARLGLAKRVKFVGYVPHAQMRDFYLDATVFAMPSVWPEPFGMAGPEAMRYGLPVVAFDAGGIKEWLKDGHNGFLVPWMDTDAFARRLQLLLTNKNLARDMGKEGLVHVNASYSAPSQIDRLEHLFRSVCDEGRIADQNRSSPTARINEAAELLDLSERQSRAMDAAPVNAI